MYTITLRITVADPLFMLFVTGKGRGKVHPTTGHEGPEGE
jgi:hypothetical protein